MSSKSLSLISVWQRHSSHFPARSHSQLNLHPLPANNRTAHQRFRHLTLDHRRRGSWLTQVPRPPHGTYLGTVPPPSSARLLPPWLPSWDSVHSLHHRSALPPPSLHPPLRNPSTLGGCDSGCLLDGIGTCIVASRGYVTVTP